MLSFELKRAALAEAPSEIEIILDTEGLESLLAQLRMLQTDRTDHVHLMSDVWGGNHLDGTARGEGNLPIHHVKIWRR